MKTLVVAEVGINHNGSLDLAHKMIDCAADNGANAIKFQVHLPNQEMVANLRDNVTIGKDLFETMSKCKLDQDDFVKLKKHCERRKVKFFATPFSLEAVDLLENIGVDLYKIGSGETNNLLLLNKVSSTGKRMLVSTGMSSYDEIQRTVSFLRERKIKDLILMQCTSQYPAPYQSIHLNTLHRFKSDFGCDVGLSDHAPTIYPAIAAVALGAIVVEKHFTIDKSLPGPDQSSSIDGPEMKELSQAIEIIEQCFGDSCKDVMVSQEVRQLFMHGLTASKYIHQGEIFSGSNITSKRPLIGIPASEFETVFGSRAARDIMSDEQIRWDDVNI